MGGDVAYRAKCAVYVAAQYVAEGGVITLPAADGDANRHLERVVPVEPEPVKPKKEKAA